MIDLDAIRKNFDSLEEASTVLDESYHREEICNAMLVSAREGRALLAYVDELLNFRACAKTACRGWRELLEMKEDELAALREAAGKMTCATCGNGGEFPRGSGHPCPDCSDLRAWLERKP